MGKHSDDAHIQLAATQSELRDSIAKAKAFFEQSERLIREHRERADPIAAPTPETQGEDDDEREKPAGA